MSNVEPLLIDGGAQARDNHRRVEEAKTAMKVKTKHKSGKIYELFPSGPAKGACK